MKPYSALTVRGQVEDEGTEAALRRHPVARAGRGACRRRAGTAQQQQALAARRCASHGRPDRARQSLGPVAVQHHRRRRESQGRGDLAGVRAQHDAHRMAGHGGDPGDRPVQDEPRIEPRERLGTAEARGRSRRQDRGVQRQGVV